MIWSRYNLILKTPYGHYLYNSYTNNLMKLSPKFIQIAERCKRGDFTCVPPETISSLKGELIIVDDDEDIYRKIKVERIMSRYDTKCLSLTIAPTTGCNFKCIYCYESGVKENFIKDKGASIDQTVQFVKSFESAKHLYVTWYGGEPLLMFDYVESLSNEFVKLFENYSAYMITNAYLLDAEKAATLKDLRIKGLQITIDGLEETHNKRRPHKVNTDSFQKIIANLDGLLIVYPEIYVSLRVNVDKENEDEYHNTYHFLKERYGKYNVNVYPGYVTDELSSEPNNCCFLYNEVNDFVIKQYDRYNIPISLYPQTEFGECCARHITSFVIGPNGELYKCWNDIGVSEKEIGNIANFSLSDKTNIRYLLDSAPLENANCKDCFCFPVCNGGCPYRRIFRPLEQDGFCEARRKSIMAFLKRHVDSKVRKL